MAKKNIAVFGMYPHRASFEYGLSALKVAGFREEDISALLQENSGSKDLATEKSTKAPEGVATGAGSGAVIGATLGWLAGIGALAIPGAGTFLAAGPLVSIFAGIGAGGTVGGLTGALVGLGIPEYEAKRYQGRIKNGAILVSIHCDNSVWEENARKSLQATGAENISSTSESAADYDVTDRPMHREPFG